MWESSAEKEKENMTGVIRQVETFHINGWTVRPCTWTDGFELLHGDERHHHDRLETAVASAQADKREVESAVTHQVGKSGVDPVRMLRIWCEELGLRAGTRETDARRALLLQVIEYIDARHETIRRLNARCQEAENLAATFKKGADKYLEQRNSDASEVEKLKARLALFTDTMPSWADGSPQDYDAWLRDLVPDDNRLRFYQWIGMLATREALDQLRDMLKNDPVPIEHRGYTPDDVHEFLDGIDPAGKGGDPVPSRLPVGLSFCDVTWHTHTDGGSRLPCCRLDSEK